MEGFLPLASFIREGKASVEFQVMKQIGWVEGSEFQDGGRDRERELVIFYRAALLEHDLLTNISGQEVPKTLAQGKMRGEGNEHRLSILMMYVVEGIAQTLL